METNQFLARVQYFKPGFESTCSDAKLFSHLTELPDHGGNLVVVHVTNPGEEVVLDLTKKHFLKVTYVYVHMTASFLAQLHM
jgi:hypothetical protein